MTTSHIHRTHRSGWLRAGVLGANDGVLSIAGLLLGVVATHMSSNGILATGFAGLIAGALSMGAGEYVSVSSQYHHLPGLQSSRFDRDGYCPAKSRQDAITQPCRANRGA